MRARHAARHQRGTMNRTLVVLSTIVATDMIGFGIIIPLLPFYSEALGATPFDL